MITTDQEITLLTQATQMAGASLMAERNKRDDILVMLKIYESKVKLVSNPYHERVKKEVLLTLSGAIRFAYSRKQSHAKITRRHGLAVAKEFARLKKLAQREERYASVSF